MHRATIYHAADLCVGEFACHLWAFGHDHCSSCRSREFSRGTRFSVRGAFFVAWLCLRVLVASTPAAGVAATVVQQAFGGGRYFLCAGSVGFAIG